MIFEQNEYNISIRGGITVSSLFNLTAVLQTTNVTYVQLLMYRVVVFRFSFDSLKMRKFFMKAKKKKITSVLNYYVTMATHISYIHVDHMMLFFLTIFVFYNS